MRVMAAGAAGRRPWGVLVLGCLALAALSLLGPHETTYDPYAWLIWGREITHLDLVTTSGPSWKPLPVLFTTPFALLGDTAAPLLWQVIARAGGLLAIAFVYRLAARFAGRGAGVAAALGMVFANQFIFNFARADSEGLLVAVCLGAIERHLDGHRRQAVLLLLAGALLRPEVWPFLGLYGLWLLREDRRAGRTWWPTLWLLSGSAAAVVVLWFVPEELGSGQFFRAASRALESVPGSPALAKYPILAVFPHSVSVLALSVYAGGLFATFVGVRAWRAARRMNPRLAFAALACALMAIVAVLTQVGFTGNLRYITLPASAVCVLAGIGWADAAGLVRRRFGALGTAALIAVGLAAALPAASRVRDQLEVLRAGAGMYTSSLPAVIHKAGGAQRVRACGPLFTGAFQTQAVAYALDIQIDQIMIHPAAPGTVIAPRPSTFGSNPEFPYTTLTKDWVIASTCRL